MDTSQDDELTGEEEPPPPTVTPQEVEVHPFTATVDDPLSTFAMDVDTASYSAARNYLLNSALPPVGTVRVEEFVNYFDYGYPNPQEGAFHIAVDGAPSPFTSDTQIVRVGIQGEQIDESQRDNAILTFVIDVSGSMDTPDRLPLVKEALTLLVEQLREGDQVAIVVYSDDTRVVLEPTSATQRDVIISAINSLQIEDSTNVEAGLRLGYQLAGEHFQNGAINRVILCSDGVANVGATGPEAIRQSIRDYAAQGVLLTTVGFGMNTYNDYLMEQLANDGNGNYAYVDTRSEAERVFVENLTGTLQVIARDAKIQVAFNPEVVSQYRLLGYENRAVADEDFRNDDVDAGEVGAGHSVTALYEVRLTGQGTGEALVVQVRYEDPESGEVIELQEPLQSDEMVASFEAAPTNMQLAVAVAGLAENLRGTGYAQDRPLSAILEIAQRLEPQFANDADVSEFVELVRRAQNLTR
jgi:Ca-activated chloride channel family protein